MKINYASHHDLKKISECHIAAFPESVTSQLGIKVISQMLSWYMSGSNKFLFWIEENDRCVGYCGGYILDGSDKYGAASGMMQASFNMIAGGLLKKPWLFFHPEMINKVPFILTNIKRKLGLKKDLPAVERVSRQENEKPLTAGLIVIGVLPNMQLKGIGSLLQQEFERKATELGAKQLQLSVKISNDKAIKSYLKNGYEIQERDDVSLGMIKKIG